MPVQRVERGHAGTSKPSAPETELGVGWLTDDGGVALGVCPDEDGRVEHYASRQPFFLEWRRHMSLIRGLHTLEGILGHGVCKFQYSFQTEDGCDDCGEADCKDDGKDHCAPVVRGGVEGGYGGIRRLLKEA